MTQMVEDKAQALLWKLYPDALALGGYL